MTRDHFESQIFSFMTTRANTHLTCAVPAILRLRPQLLISVDEAVGTAGLLAVTSLKLGQPGLGVI